MPVPTPEYANPPLIFLQPSVAPPIRRPRPPPLLPFGAIKHRLAKLPIDLVMRAAQPLAKLVTSTNLGLLAPQVALEVLGADPARVQLGEEADEAQQVRLLRAGRGLGVRRRDGVQQRPRAAPEHLDVWRAVGRRATGRGRGRGGGGGRGSLGAAVDLGVGDFPRGEGRAGATTKGSERMSTRYACKISDKSVGNSRLPVLV